jgi:hypothetical protein
MDVYSKTNIAEPLMGYGIRIAAKHFPLVVDTAEFPS